jgi:hypothetical protein
VIFFLSIIKFLFSWLTARDNNQTQIAIATLNASVESYKAATSERTALMIPWVYTLLVSLIVGPPAVHWASIYIDTVLTNISLGIPAAPPPYNEYEFKVLLGFLGISGVATTALSIAKRIWR